MNELERRIRLAASSQVPAFLRPVPDGKAEETAAAEVLTDARPVGPAAAEKTGLLAEEQTLEEIEGPEAIVAGRASAEDAEDELPPLEELVKRLRPEVLATMDELFRAKWTGVKRLRPEDLKGG
jgi:hypothetical protein